jgi:hypothetical protein
MASDYVAIRWFDSRERQGDDEDMKSEPADLVLPSLVKMEKDRLSDWRLKVEYWLMGQVSETLLNDFTVVSRAEDGTKLI